MGNLKWLKKFIFLAKVDKIYRLSGRKRDSFSSIIPYDELSFALSDFKIRGDRSVCILACTFCETLQLRIGLSFLVFGCVL